MIRQAHTYLAGAVSGTALIAAAVVTFVLLVSAQAFRDWPLPGLPDLGGGSNEVSSADGGRSAAGGATSGGAATTTGVGGATGTTAAGGAKSPDRQGGGQAGAVADSPATGSPAAGSPDGSPTAGSPAAGASPGGGSPPAGSSGSASPGSGSGGGGGGQTSGGGGGSSSPSTSGQVTGLVNDTVSGVDQATGGALGNTGVTKATEEVVKGVAGPESPVGKTVDKVADTVGGLLGGNK